MQTVTFIPPTLCACRLNITADFTNVLDENGDKVSYKHPIPFTIQSIEIVSVCRDHESLTTDPLPIDPFNGRKGYMNVPKSPTEAENLYLHLCGFTGQLARPDTCGCKVYQVIDAQGNMQIKNEKSHICEKHLVAEEAIEDNVGKNRTVALIKENLGLTEEPEFILDVDRTLRIKLPQATSMEKTAIQEEVELRLNKTVIIE